MPWTLRSEFTFDSAHVITGYDGPCGRLHGHTYKVRMELSSARLRPSDHVKRDIMGADFKTLKWAKKDIKDGEATPLPEVGGNCATYLFRELDAAAATDFPASFTSGGTLTVWLNGEKIHTNDKAKPEATALVLKLKAGI